MRKLCLPLFAACLLLLPACSGDKNADKAAQAAPVHVRPVARQSLPRLLHVVGNVKASASVAVTPRVTGEIREVHFTEGQDVKAGDPLITIDTRPFEAVLREKRGLLAKSQAQLNKALDDRGRYGKLVGGGYVSRESYEQTATEAAALKATVQSDKAAVESAELDLSYCRVTAPISGRVGALAVDKGNMVQGNASTPVVTIDTLSPIYVTFSVPEVHLSVILERMRHGPVHFTASPTGGKAERGLLTLVDNEVDTRTGTIRLRGTFANEDRSLWPGQFVTVDLPLGRAENALTVPSTAVQSGRDGAYLYLAGPDDTAVLRKVRVLFEHEGTSVVEGDLKEGDRVVVEGIVRLAPGLPLRVLDD
ncbi:efflux RND transporter periplasmic adaptor subunit [uncultured Desulfovibrio sp.]|uniref:efflux RND transporter periplasmic adaptor subunit n=1 Tax=uncultured Desulfovibrio sp. TaxID=167968 RepID=UPI00260CF021|nr:efflux RND transporter periplasmic adaptor subunit [uncultured Desulfovibrio sp.]